MYEHFKVLSKNVLAICAITVGVPLSQQVSCSSKICFASSPLHSSYTATNYVLLAALVFEILSIATGKLMNNELVPSTLNRQTSQNTIMLFVAKECTMKRTFSSLI